MPFALPTIDPSDWTTFELLQCVVDTIPDPIFVKDRQHRWIACNQAFCVLFGQRYEDMIGRSDRPRSSGVTTISSSTPASRTRTKRSPPHRTG